MTEDRIARAREALNRAIEKLDTMVLGPDDWQGALSDIRSALASLPDDVSEDPPMVPRYPTEAMMDAGMYHCSADMEYSDLFTAWTAMFDCIALDGGATAELPAAIRKATA